MPTVSYDVNYIILNPDRLFKTVSDGFRCSKMLWRYVGIIQGCPFQPVACCRLESSEKSIDNFSFIILNGYSAL